MHKSWTSVATLALALGLTACGGSEGQSAGAATPAAGGGRGGRGDPNRIVPVEVAVARHDSIVHVVALSGSVEPIRRVGVNSQLSGALLSVNAEEGTQVRKDQVLAQIDAREVQSQLTSAEAALAAATATMERSEKMREAQIITDVEYERDRTALAAAKSQRDQLQTRIGYATVKSPIDGVVLEKRMEAGDVVGAQTRLFTVADVSTLVVKVDVSELEVAGLRVGQEVVLSVDALSDARLGGRIRRVFPSADSTTRLVPVEVELTGADVAKVKPGYLARVTFRSAARDNALLVPAAAIMIASGTEVVFKVSEGVARRQVVRSGLNYAAQIEILDGLVAGDTVVVTGNNSLRDGQRLRIMTAPLESRDMSGGTVTHDDGAAVQPSGSGRSGGGGGR